MPVVNGAGDGANGSAGGSAAHDAAGSATGSAAHDAAASATDVAHNSALRSRLLHNLTQHEVRAHRTQGRRRAAVCVIVLDSDATLHGTDDHFDNLDQNARLDLLAEVPGLDDPALRATVTGAVSGTAGGSAVLLTRRGAALNKHAGQWALPGGRIDAGETALQAAMREAQEEVGLELSAEHLLGQLDDYPTRSGFVITPFVFWLDQHTEPVANEDEVASIHRIALRELSRPDSPRFIQIPESDRPVIQVPIGGDLIHAPTGAVLYQFRAVAYDGQDVRVDHYEQPVFAWR